MTAPIELQTIAAPVYRCSVEHPGPWPGSKRAPERLRHGERREGRPLVSESGGPECGLHRRRRGHFLAPIRGQKPPP